MLPGAGRSLTRHHLKDRWVSTDMPCREAAWCQQMSAWPARILTRRTSKPPRMPVASDQSADGAAESAWAAKWGRAAESYLAAESGQAVVPQPGRYLGGRGQRCGRLTASRIAASVDGSAVRADSDGPAFAGPVEPPVPAAVVTASASSGIPDAAALARS